MRGLDCGFDVRSQSELSAFELVRDYMAVGKPVLIKGMLSGSEPAMGAWFSGVRWTRESLLRAHGSTRVQVGDIPHAASFGLPSETMSLGDFYNRVLDERTGSGRSIASQSFGLDDPTSLAHGFNLPKTSVLDPAFTALHPKRVLLTLGPRGAGTPMRYGRAAVDLLMRGKRTWLLQAPSDATYSARHPADLTATAPWPWPKEQLYSCDQEAGDVIYVPDGWSKASLLEEEALSFMIEAETGANEFSIDV